LKEGREQVEDDPRSADQKAKDMEHFTMHSLENIHESEELFGTAEEFTGI
jgi:hypothetical protein